MSILHTILALHGLISYCRAFRKHTSPTYADFTILLDGLNYNLEETRPAIYLGLSAASKIGTNKEISNTLHDTFKTNIFQYENLNFTLDAKNSIISLTMSNLEVQYYNTWFGIYEIPYDILCDGTAKPQVSIKTLTLQWGVSTDESCLLYIDYLEPIIINDDYSVNYKLDTGTCDSLIDVFVGDLTSQMEDAVRNSLPDVVNDYIEEILTIFVPTNMTITGRRNNKRWKIQFGVCFQDIMVEKNQITTSVSMQFNQTLNDTFRFNNYKSGKNNKNNTKTAYAVNRTVATLVGLIAGAATALGYLWYQQRKGKASFDDEDKAVDLVDTKTEETTNGDSGTNM